MHSNNTIKPALTNKQYLKELFNFKNYSWIKWFIFAGVLISLTSFGLILAGIAVNTIRHDDPTAFWFYSLHFFTQQSNLLIIFFIISYWLFPKSKIFNKHTLLIFCMAYITVTFIGYNCILLPSDISSGAIKANTDFDWTITVFLHMIMPIYFLSLFIILTLNTKSITPLPWYKIEGYGMIYPLIYLIYAIILPFISKFSVYGSFTNLNPNNSAIEAGGEPGSLFNLVYIIGFAVLFIVCLWIYWFIPYKYNKKLNK